MAATEGLEASTEASQEDLLRFEQIKLLYEAMPVSIAATLISSVVLVLVEWNVVEHILLIGWLVALLVITAARALITVAYRRARPKPWQTSRWERYFLAGTVAAGMIWGSASWVAFPENLVAHQVFLVFIVGGMCAGAVTSLSPIRIMVLSFLLLSLIPLIVHFFVVGSEIAIAMGLMLLVFLILISTNAIKGCRNTVQNIVLRLESANREAVIRRAEEALSREALFRKSIIDRAGEGLCVCHSISGFPFVRFTVWNRRMHQITGYAMEEINRKGWYQSLYPDPDYQQEAMKRMDAMRQGEDLLSEEWEITRADGQKRAVLISTSIITGDSEEPRVLALISDITRQRQVDAELRESQARYSNIVNLAHDAVISIDESQHITVFNKAAETIFGYSQGEAIGQKLDILVPERFRSLHRMDIASFGTNKLETPVMLAGRGITGLRKNGEEFPAYAAISSFKKAGKSEFTAFLKDITEQKALEEQLRQSQKMEAIGTLVGGIAHDFNNILSGIVGNIYLAKLKIEDKAEAIKALEEAEFLSRSAAGMINQLLTFARRGEIEMGVFPLNPFLREALKLAGSAIPENIHLNYQICTDDLIVRGDATQLQQVIMNLLNNARDALADVSEPVIHCEFELYSATDEFRRMHPDLKGDCFARLTVRDNGCGIAEDKLNQIFDPFFTTKEVGKGTGLGLSMAFGSVQSHGGVIEVESEPGEGTAFHVYLPLQKQAEKSEVKKTIAAVKGHGESILMVEDDEVMRGITAMVLDSLDYKVLNACDGEEALEIFKTHQHDIDLILTDIVMPKMGGVDLAKSIRLLDKHVPIIFATGYDRGDTLSSDVQVDQSVIINKPLLVVELSQLIQRMLESRVR